MTLKTLAWVRLLKDPKYKAMVLFSASRGFLPECHACPDSVVVKKGRGCVACWGWGWGCPPPTVLPAPVFSLGSPQFFAQRWGESSHEWEFTWRCSRAGVGSPTLAHPQKWSQTSLNQHFNFHPLLLNKCNLKLWCFIYFKIKFNSFPHSPDVPSLFLFGFPVDRSDDG